MIDDETGRAYRSNFLTPSDEGMLWSAIFLDLLENPGEPPAIMRVSPSPAVSEVVEAAADGA